MSAKHESRPPDPSASQPRPPEAPGEPATVVVADHDPLYLGWLTSCVEASPSLALIGSAGDGRKALGLLRGRRPRVALLDQDLSGHDAIEVLHDLARTRLEVAVVVISGVPGATRRPYESVAAGARGYLTRAAGAQEIITALMRVAAGHVVIEPSVQGGIFKAFRERRGSPASLDSDTQLLLRLIALGLEPSEIAVRLKIPEETLDRRLKALCDYFAVSSWTRAALEALKQGLIE